MNKVNLMNLNFGKDVYFTGKRTDKNLVDELVQGKQSLFKPKERQIIEAINRISDDSNKENIEFLLSVTENLKYGTKKGSVINNYLNTTSPIANREQKQNVNWEELLQTAVRKSLDKTDVKEKPELEERYSKLFVKPELPSDEASKSYWLSVNPVAQKEAEATRLADKILNSEEFARVPENLSSEETKKLHATKETVKTDMGYFLASSETSILEKVECLKLFNHLMSPDYKINPQLKDKKVQALSEILNDIVVQTPEQEMLKSKTVIQLDGICANVSQKKALASEHKVKYVANVMAELDDKPTMEVFDVTDPSKKVIVEKTFIDYNDAKKKGYERVLTPATMSWMHIADSIGNGELQAGKYTAFDPDNYEMARDSHWVGDMPPELQPKQSLLRAVIKANSAIMNAGSHDCVEQDKLEKMANDQESRTIEKRLVKTMSSAHKSVESCLKQLLPDTEAGKIKSLSEKLLDPRKVDNPELKIDSREEDSVKKQKIGAIIKAEIPDFQENKLNSAYKEFGKNKISYTDSIFGDYKEVEEVVGKDRQLADAHSPAKKAEQYSHLFKVAAYYRVKKEREFDIPENLAGKVNAYGVPASKEEALEQLEKQGRILPRKTLDNLESKFDEIEKFQRIDYKIAAREGKKLDESKIYSFSKEQIDALDQIEGHYSEIKKEITRDYKELNKAKNNELEPELKKLYANTGKARGHFWVGEEGRSGLGSDQQARIITQMSGKPHYIDKNIITALDHVEAGLGGGASSTSVSHKEAAGHAQYVNDVDYVPVKDPKTGEITNKRALFHDNTWGPSEKDGYDHVWGDKHKFTLWKDPAGNFRTDYGRDFGGPGGFIFRNNYTTGVLQDYFHTGTLVHKPEHVDNSAMKKLDHSIGVESGMFWDLILKGSDPKSSQKASSTINIILEKQETDKEIAKYMNGLIHLNEADAAKLKADLKKLKDVGKNADHLDERLSGVINGSHSEESIKLKLEKGINSREDYDKLPDDHILKLMLRKTSMLEVSKYSFGYLQFGMIEKATTQKDLDNVNEKLVDVQKSAFKECVKKYNNIESLSELEKDPTGKAVINWIDKKFNPKDNKEFISVYNNFAGMEEKKVDGLLNNSTDKELGVVYEDPCSLVLRLKGKNEQAKDSFRDAISRHCASEARNELSDVGSKYRELNIMFSHIMKVKNRQDGFDKYGVRPAIPELNVYNKEVLKQDVSANLLQICEIAQGISELKQQKEGLKDKPAKEEKIEKQVSNLKLSLKQSAICLVKANVIPREQNTALEMMTKLFKSYAENPESDKSIKLFDNTADLITEKHLTNHPKEMLEYVTKETPKIMQDSKNKEMNKQIISAWGQYMADSIKTAYNSYLEFKLMDRISDGEMPHEAALLKDPNSKYLAGAESGRPIPITSPEGMGFLIQSLEDPDNNNSTLKFFVQQTGLTNDAVNCMLSGPTPKQHAQIALTSLNDIKKHGDDMEMLMKATQEFETTSVDDNFDRNNTKTVVDLYFKIIDKPFKEKGMENNETLKRFKENLLNDIKKSEELGKTGLTTFVKAQANAVKTEGLYNKQLVIDLNERVNVLKFKHDMLSSFDELLPDRSEMKAKSMDYKDDINKSLKQIDKHYKQLAQ